MSRTWANLEALEAVKALAVATAEAMLAGEVGVIEGCRILASAGHDLVADWTLDDDFVVFGALASETDHLDVGAQRVGWNSDALAAQDGEVARMETSARDQVLRACRSVVARFHP